MDIAMLETPFLTIDLDAVERNVARAQAYCDAHGLRFRPHVKTHKLPRIARLQVDAGAVGITCQKISEAEVMVDAGLDDVLLTYPVLGEAKARRLARLAERCTLAVAADSLQAALTVAEAARASGRTIGFLVECDTGGGRLGAQTPEAAAELAAAVATLPGLAFRGLMTYPTSPGTRAFMEEATELLAVRGLHAEVISGGGTPALYRSHELGGVTEVRAGEYALGDRSGLALGVVGRDDLAARVVTTVVGRPTADRALLDAGSKTLSYDRADAPQVQGYGLLLEHPEAVITEFSEEHAHVDLRACAVRPRIGDRVTVVPNHVCPCVNLHDEVALHRGGVVEEIVRVSARGTIR